MSEWNTQQIRKQGIEKIIKNLKAIHQYLETKEFNPNSEEFKLSEGYCLAVQEYLADEYEQYNKAMEANTTDEARKRIIDKWLVIGATLRLSNLIIGHFKGIRIGQTNLLARFGNYRDIIV